LLNQKINFCIGLGFFPCPIIELGVHVPRLAVKEMLSDELLRQCSLV